MPQRRLSELESFVLGLVWRHGPLTAYEIRRLLAQSPSTQWTASAGSIYPLVARLERSRHLKSALERNGRRSRRNYALTPLGHAALQSWIGPPLDEQAITVTHDPLRSRARFLAALTPSQRRRWVDAALEALVEVERRVDAWHALHASAGDPFAALVTRHGQLDLAFRRAWLREVRAAGSGAVSRPASARRGAQP